MSENTAFICLDDCKLIRSNRSHAPRCESTVMPVVTGRLKPVLNISCLRVSLTLLGAARRLLP